jgi:hypothetical protein
MPYSSTGRSRPVFFCELPGSPSGYREQVLKDGPNTCDEVDSVPAEDGKPKRNGGLWPRRLASLHDTLLGCGRIDDGANFGYGIRRESALFRMLPNR